MEQPSSLSDPHGKNSHDDMIQNQGFIGDEDHIVRVEDLGIISFFFLFLRLAELEDLVETVQDLIACPADCRQSYGHSCLAESWEQPAHQSQLSFPLLE